MPKLKITFKHGAPPLTCNGIYNNIVLMHGISIDTKYLNML